MITWKGVSVSDDILAGLPDNLRPSEPVPTRAKLDGNQGYAVATGNIETFSRVMSMASVTMHGLERSTPRFEGWNLAPGAGVPVIGLLFVNRLNRIADTWSDCARLLREVLEDDSKKLASVAARYRTAHGAAERAVDHSRA
ncbi:hypothetical protein ACIBHX_41230 [Nonomuraea sp. NPDC050536]|uniref:hypothetical protein n=1 Tax=Nonomuraea sp. NPDC050536 TaxID=3364366 RepID=UPI0037C6658E